MTVYTASKVKYARLWRDLRSALSSQGVEIISTWIDEEEEGVSDYPDLAQRCIQESGAPVIGSEDTISQPKCFPHAGFVGASAYNLVAGRR